MVTMSGGTHSIVLLDQKDEANSFYLEAQVKPSGDLALAGNDCGALPLSCFGDEDYEYSRSVGARDVPKVLLWLLKERFTSDVAFEAWCKEKEIPTRFSYYI